MACVVPGCRSGYGAKSQLPPGVQMHRFPKPPEQCEAWTKAIPRANWVPKTRSRVCSLHFDKSDYTTDHSDTNTRRKHSKDKLNVARLKPTAVPRIFPGCPSYLSTKKPTERAEVCKSEERRRQEIIQAELKAQAFLNEDYISSQDDIFNKKYDFPSSWNISSIKISSKIVFEGVGLHLDGKPFFKFTLTIDEKLNFGLTRNELTVLTSLVNHITPNNVIERHSDVFNFLAFLNAQTDSDLKKEDILNDCVAKLSLVKDGLPNSDIPKLDFIIDQLKLALLPVNSRRYSPTFLWTCLRWMKTSAALYNALQDENFLCLPSTSHLKRLSSAYSLETGLSEATTAYLSERIKPLSDREKTVAVLIDEVNNYF